MLKIIRQSEAQSDDLPLVAAISSKFALHPAITSVSGFCSSGSRLPCAVWYAVGVEAPVENTRNLPHIEQSRRFVGKYEHVVTAESEPPAIASNK